MTTVGQVAGMADLAGRSSGTIAASLLGLGEARQPMPRTPYVRSTRRSGGTVIRADTTAAEDRFRSPYRLSGDELLLLDQRGIPDALDEVSARRGSDVAYYLRVGACRGGPLMAQVAAYGLALTARERVRQPPAARDVELRRTRRALVQARPSSRLLAWTMERMEAVQAQLDEGARRGESPAAESPAAEAAAAGADEAAASEAAADAPAGVDGEALAAALWREAEAIAAGFMADHAAISAATAELLAAASTDERPLAVLLHGDTGTLTGGQIGTGIPALRQLVEAGRQLRVFVTETRPFMDGARLAGWELRQAGIEHQVITDSAVAWLLSREPLDAVIVGAEWVAANGDVGAVVGSRAIALQAAATATGPDGRRPLVLALGVSHVIDVATADADAIPVELRPARDLAAYLADVPIRHGSALVPASDVMPASSVSALVTERGVLSPVEATAIASLVSEPPDATKLADRHDAVAPPEPSDPAEPPDPRQPPADVAGADAGSAGRPGDDIVGAHR